MEEGVVQPESAKRAVCVASLKGGGGVGRYSGLRLVLGILEAPRA